MLSQYIFWFLSWFFSFINGNFWLAFLFGLWSLFWFCTWILSTKVQKLFFLTVVLFSFVFLNVWFYSDLIFLNMINPLGLKFTVKDPQDYINFKLVWSFFLAIFCVIFFISLHSFFLIFGFVTISFKSLWIYFVWLFIFYFGGLYFIVKEDLLFSSWPDISSLKFLEDIFAVLPDFSRVSSTFISEFLRLLLSILNLSLIYFIQQTVVNKMALKLLYLNWKENLIFIPLKKILVARFLLTCLLFEILFSFYGGESITRDLVIVLLSFICVELSTFSLLFFSHLRFWKGF